MAKGDKGAKGAKVAKRKKRNGLHPLVKRASQGQLPEWAAAGRARRAHMGRVAELMGEWAVARGETKQDVKRWMAAGYLHDVLREQDPKLLRRTVPKKYRDLPGRMLHGPAAAVWLEKEGVQDTHLLRAIAFHTVGNAGLAPIGRALYAADFLEPKRRLRPKWRAKLRGRMPAELDSVVAQILGARIVHLVKKGSSMRPETAAFWNDLTERGGP